MKSAGMGKLEGQKNPGEAGTACKQDEKNKDR
jgi:hypothetical protein